MSEQAVDLLKVEYGIVSNIPGNFRSADLRVFFTSFIESCAFHCFHFRHRPEIKRSKDGNTEKDKSGTTCCVVALKENKLKKFIRCYNGQNWVDQHGKYYAQKAVISRMKLKKKDPLANEEGVTSQEEEESQPEKEVTEEDLKSMIELNPPPVVMPHGNVGTPMKIFMDLIKDCKIPPSLIKKLGLKFPKSFSKRKYGNVPLNYNRLDSVKYGHYREDSEGSFDPDEKNSRGTDSTRTIEQSHEYSRIHHHTRRKKHKKPGLQHVIVEEGSAIDVDNGGECSTHRGNFEDSPETKENDGARCDSSDGEEEDWERHETLHDDVHSQDRTKERLYEEEMEVVWEKGGSGLVFYTDAFYWNQTEGGDFDEQTADDWDVDMGVYEEEGAGDKDAKDLLQMRIEEQWKKGNAIDFNRKGVYKKHLQERTTHKLSNETEVKRIGDFEKHTKGFAGNLMRRQGWTEGGSLGGSQKGPAEPIATEGQLPSCKKGMGYYNEKLDRNVKRQKVAEHEVRISTVYDEKDEDDDNPLLRRKQTTIKYWDPVQFIASDKLLQ